MPFMWNQERLLKIGTWRSGGQTPSWWSVTALSWSSGTSGVDGSFGGTLCCFDCSEVGVATPVREGLVIKFEETSNFRDTWSNLRPLLEVRAGPTRLCTSRKGPARVSGCHIWPWHLFPFSVRVSHCSESPHGERRVLVLRCAATAHLPAAALLRRLLDLKTLSLKA